MARVIDFMFSVGVRMTQQQNDSVLLISYYFYLLVKKNMITK